MGQAAIVYLIGFPGCGKFTVGNELVRLAAERGERLVLVDNHHINNTIFEFADVDGIKELPPAVWAHVATVRDAVLATIEQLGPPTWSYVFTNVLFAGDPGDEAHVGRLAQLAASRGSRFLPVRLDCDVDELARRVTSPERRDRLKWMDADGLRRLATTRRLVDVPNDALDLDVTTVPAAVTAQHILDHLGHHQPDG